MLPSPKSDLAALAKCGTDSAMAEYPQLGRVYSFTGGEIEAAMILVAMPESCFATGGAQEPHIREYRLRGDEPGVAQPIARRSHK